MTAAFLKADGKVPFPRTHYKQKSKMEKSMVWQTSDWFSSKIILRFLEFHIPSASQTSRSCLKVESGFRTKIEILVKMYQKISVISHVKFTEEFGRKFILQIL
ncbi:hypothetical protein HELRODRAFT_175811 [Helobdella robusta]|uniref:Uncharacterized protein n=1 Tax=Helobdella robusta TaxID=6412 RepID=T1F9P7_HELRO|nr:hypothetical protein HELRODRAFT_175811 [Helobdella robusta]ESO00394.1 hypothetical protein HELRODRAFT_175811 [Helobdella robusta]